MIKDYCKTCTLNTTGDTLETCKRMCYRRYESQRKNRIYKLEDKINIYKKAFEEIKEIVNRELDVRLMQINGQAPMIFNADFHNKIKQPILDKINEVEE